MKGTLVISILICILLSVFVGLLLVPDGGLELNEIWDKINVYDIMGGEPELEGPTSFDTRNYSIKQYKECVNITKYRDVADTNETIVLPNKSVVYNITWKMEYYQIKECYIVEKYNISTSTTALKIDATVWGACSHQDNCIICDTHQDGNADGKCHSGETCFKFCYDGIGIKSEYNYDSKVLSEKLAVKTQSLTVKQ